MLLESQLNETENAWEINIYGEVDIYNASELKQGLARLIDDKKANIYLHCENLKYIDSTGLGVLVSILKKIKDQGFTVKILGIASHLKKIFDLTGLNKLFEIEEQAQNAEQ